MLFSLGLYIVLFKSILKRLINGYSSLNSTRCLRQLVLSPVVVATVAFSFFYNRILGITSRKVLKEERVAFRKIQVPLFGFQIITNFKVFIVKF